VTWRFGLANRRRPLASSLRTGALDDGTFATVVRGDCSELAIEPAT
jgi:hypothetical protein